MHKKSMIQATRRMILTAAVAGLAAAGYVATSASAQDGGRRMVMMSDDGDGPHILQMSHIDIHGLREPDFIRTDLSIFDEVLRLSEPQEFIVQELLNTYLRDFEALVLALQDALPKSGPGALAMGEPIRMRAGGGGNDGGGEAAIEIDGMDLVFGFSPEMFIAPDMDLEGEDGGPRGMSIAIAVQADAGGGGGAGAAGGEGPNVSVEIATPEGVEMSDEMRKQLEEQVKAMQEKIQKQMEERAANGELGRGPMRMDVEEMKKQNEQVRAAAEKFKKDKADLKQRFLGNVRGQLDAEQIERWPKLERTLTRQKTLKLGRLDGERTDLFSITRSMGLPDDARDNLSQLLNEYEVSLHDALVRRNAFLEDANQKVDDAVGAKDFKKALSTIDRAADLRIAVRNTNQQFAERMSQSLGAGLGEGLKERYLKVSYPRVYRVTTGQRILEKARLLEGLSAETQSEVDALHEAYLRELGVVNETIRQAIDRHQPRESREGIEHMQKMQAGERPAPIHMGDDPVREVMRQRTALDERYVTALKGLLSPEQMAELPKMPVRGKGGPVIFRMGN